MSIFLLLSLAAFALALVHAGVLDTWRRNIEREDGDPRPGSQEAAPSIYVSVVVPVRNGADSIVPLLQDLYAQRYPKTRYEVIVVDDASTDSTVQRVKGLMHNWPQLRLVQADGAGKKAAITTGVRSAVGELVLFTDADVRCGPERVSVLAAFWSLGKPAMVLMPVRLDGDGRALHRLQRVEHHALQGATMGSGLDGRPVLANGANMAVVREAFERVGGFGASRWASGDDLFLLRRIRRARWPVVYLADGRTIVTTAPEDTWAGFVAQRLRWAGKMWAFVGAAGTWSAAFAVVFPWALVLLSAAVVHHVRIGQNLLYTMALLAAAWGIWLFPVLRLVDAAARHLTPGPSMRSGMRARMFTVLALCAFMVYAPVIGLLSLVVRPRWKGRRSYGRQSSC